MDAISYEIGRLSGILEAFGLMSGDANRLYNYEISVLEHGGSLDAAARRHVAAMRPDAAVEVEPLPSWSASLRHCLERWLFVSDQVAASSAFDRDELIDDLCCSIDDALGVTAGVRVLIRADDWFEESWDDIALEGEQGSVLVHFGASD